MISRADLRERPGILWVGASILVGVLGGLLLLPVTTYLLTVGRAMPLLYAPAAGLWFLPPLTAMLMLRRPGSGLVAAAFSGIVLALGSPFGPQALGLVVFGLVFEANAAIRRYRDWSVRLFTIGVLVGCVLQGLSVLRRYEIVGIGLPGLLVFFALLVISAGGALVLAATIARVAGGARWVRDAQGKRADDYLGEEHGPETSRAIAEGWMYDGGSLRKPDTTP